LTFKRTLVFRATHNKLDTSYRNEGSSFLKIFSALEAIKRFAHSFGDALFHFLSNSALGISIYSIYIYAVCKSLKYSESICY